MACGGEGRRRPTNEEEEEEQKKGFLISCPGKNEEGGKKDRLRRKELA